MDKIIDGDVVEFIDEYDNRRSRFVKGVQAYVVGVDGGWLIVASLKVNGYTRIGGLPVVVTDKVPVSVCKIADFWYETLEYRELRGIVQ